MTTISDFHPIIQATLLSFSGSSLSEIADKAGVSKVAIHKQVQKGIEHLRSYRRKSDVVPKISLDEAQEKIKKLETLTQHLRRELIICSVKINLLEFFKSKVLQVFPRFKSGQLPAREKKLILDALEKFQKAGGLLKDFGERIGKSSDTLSRWQKLFEKYGLAGLAPKKSRPKHFGNKIPLWVREQVIALFLKYPRWTPYQYHSYVRHHPLTAWYVSITTIVKLKNIHRTRSEYEKNRIKKRWCFAKGVKVWTIDFVCILKTEQFKLQLLTISDHRSRFLFPTALFLNTSTDTVIDYLEELFIKYGKPDFAKADNGGEFRLDCREQLRKLAVHLLSSPQHYGQFNGAHERIHRELRAFIDDFDLHHNLMRLLEQIRDYEKQHNFEMRYDYLEGNTPADIYFGDGSFIPKNVEVVTPYEKEGEIRMKFTDRDGNPARLSLPLLK